jgi:phosphoenolpyruvate carboxykinase (GTP)
MLPFCGYNMADYFGHWLRVGAGLSNPPKIFRINWFNRDEQGKFIWPGFGDNLRVLKWVIERCAGRGDARETPIGTMPTANAIDTEGLNLPPAAMQRLLEVDEEGWKRALAGQEEFFNQFGARLPGALREENDGLRRRLRKSA